MAENERAKAIARLCSLLDLESDEINAFLQKKGMLMENIKDLSVIKPLPAKKVVAPNGIEVGMYMYADGVISPEIIEGKQITSVVGYVGEGSGLAVCRVNISLPWSSDVLSVGTTRNLSGKDATQKIINASIAQNKRAEAAEFCFVYAQDGVKAGEAFLASREEWELVHCHKCIINRAMDRLQGHTLRGRYWAATEITKSLAGIIFDDGWLDAECKLHKLCFVRPFLSFTF